VLRKAFLLVTYLIMTTFQVIIDSIIRVLSGIIPFSASWASQFEDYFLNFTTRIEIDYLVTLILSVALAIYFRFDWLGLISALVKTIFKPTSIQREHRTLDQEVLIFLASISIPALLLHHWIAPLVTEVELLHTPIAYGILSLISFAILRFASRWNRRIRGLNHLRTIDAIPIILMSILSAHPAFPLAFVFWIGFSLTNYHYDAIFKYSMMLLGIRSFAHFFHLSESVAFKEALDTVGFLNSVAVIVVCFTIVWMVIDHLQKSLSENTLRSFQWLSIFASISSFVLHFLKG
jgi:hypothetical protein